MVRLSLEPPYFQGIVSTCDRCTESTGVALSPDSPRDEGKRIRGALHAITPNLPTSRWRPAHTLPSEGLWVSQQVCVADTQAT